jgi:hypothetical protein
MAEGGNIVWFEDHYIDADGKRWGLSCPWPPKAGEPELPAFLCIDAERRKRAWEGVKLTNAWTGETEETWKKRQNDLQAARDEYDRQIAATKREKAHPGQYWDPTTRTWEKRVTATVTPAARTPVAGWACPGMGTTCCMAACDGGRTCMMKSSAGEVA